MMLACLAFIAVGAAVIGFLYLSMLHIIDLQIDGALSRDVKVMTAAYERDGYNGLRQTVEARASPQPDALRFYLLSGPAGVLTGNLHSWPNESPPSGVVADVAIDRKRARIQTIDFGDGVRLLVGRSLSERMNFEKIARESLFYVLVANLLLGAAAGTLLSRYASGRLGEINTTVQGVLDGNLSGRVAVGDGGDEYDHLARNINAMLDRIQRLIATVRGVTENIAHDLRTPLNRMRGRLELALMSTRTTEEYQGVLNRAISETETIVDTFNGILKIARISSGALALPQTHVDLAEIVIELADLYHVFAEESGITLEVRLAPATPESSALILGDVHLVSQAASNLLDNAIKYSSSGGHVIVGSWTSAGRAYLTVEDNGPGIPEDKRAIILERFVRLEGTSGKRGFGLGLNFVLAVAEWHKARLILEDNKPGLRATLEFPAADSTRPANSG